MHFELFYIRWEKKRKNEQGSAGFQKLFLGVHQGHLRVANGNRLTVENTTVSIQKRGFKVSATTKENSRESGPQALRKSSENG